MTKPVVLRLGKINYADEAWEELEKVAQVVKIPDSTTRKEFIELLKNPKSELSKVQVIARTYWSVDQTGLFDEELISSLPESVVAICNTSAGYEQINVPELRKRQIQLSNCQEIVNGATADTNVFLILNALRNFDVGSRNLASGKWPTGGRAAGSPIGHDPKGKVVGFLGMGGIGKEVAKRLKPFGFSKIIYNNRRQLPPGEDLGCEYVSFDELLRQSDILSINVPLTKDTRHIINAETIQKMKPSVIIVNTARGLVIDEAALIQGLESGHVGAVGLDVFEKEPQVPKELIESPSAALLPHMGTFTYETEKEMEEGVVNNVRNVISKGTVLTPVPEMRNDDWLHGKPLA